MNTKTLLIADSGSTKTDWCLLSNGKKKNFQTQGINPYFLQESDILSIFQNEIKPAILKTPIDEIHFYGAGINSEDKKKVIEKSLKLHFQIKKVHTYSDMLAAARASCQQEKGIACILGTGSNSCYYNGKTIGYKTKALGYILGDEGGGTQLGKKVLQYHLHGIFDKELQDAFTDRFDTDADTLLENIYRKPFANRYIAQFASFIFEHRGHYMIENIAEDCINDFFINHLLQYPQVWKVPVHFSGSVAFYLKDMIELHCEQYEIECGQIVQKPIKGLIGYHSI
jgi:N-acetylglucosamine kinase-like BadF-type ATPase